MSMGVTKSDFLNKIIIFIAGFTAGGFGSVISWTSPSLVHLKSNRSDFPISKAELSWIAPLQQIGLIIGFFIIPIVINKMRRKWILLIFSLPQVISWILIVVANNPITICIGRLVGGIGYGGGLCALTIFLSEIATKNARGIFLGFVKMFTSMGILLTMLLGAYSSYNLMNVILLASVVVLIFIFFFMPDSSYFQEKTKQTEKEIMMLDLKDNFEIKKNSNLNESAKLNPKESLNKEKKTFILKIKEYNLWKVVTIPTHRRALIILFFCAAADVFSGHAVIRMFTQRIFTYKGACLAPEKATLLLASIKVISSLICTQVIERVRRKVLLLITGLLGSLGLGLVGLFFFLENLNVNVSSINWLPIFGVGVYEFMLTIGCGNFIYIYPGELFPSELKGIAVTSSQFVQVFLIFCSIWQYQLVVDLVSTYIIFWNFAITGFVLCFIVLKIVPETQGKSVEEIQILLKTKRFFNYF